RALNLLGAAMLLGGAGFLAWIGRDFPIVRRYLVAGWWVGGVSAILMLVHHTAQVAGVPLISAVRTPELGIVLLNTRFGALWWVRGLAWAAAGVILWRRGAIPLAGAVGGGGIILASGLYSHSTAMHDAFPAVINTLVHGLCAALWVGGLGAFLLTIGGLRRRENYGVFTLATITGRFSNYARIAVGGVALSGLYAGWLHVGTGDALLGTEYGRALLIKSLLLLPAFLVAGVNLILTGRALRGGSVLWAGRLRMLVGAEVALTAGVLVAVGVMTALQPARAAYAESIRRTALTETTVFREETMVEDGTHIRLEITPNRVGLNTFRVSLWSMVTLENIPNAARVFLRFRHSTKDLQRTELELANEGNGWYGAVGGNMSLPGTWHVRVTVKQAEKFDLLWDFTPTPRVQPPPFDPAAPLAGGMILRWLVGIAALILGGMAIAGGRGNLSGLVFAVILITLGGAMLIGIAL
ncbi:MAG TPA: CopD family protein, partial [Aggregatilineales bacterium]|nr:CopD family protein [Aggregatilineales bacterium]